jgi:hypothetical protein
MFKFRHKAEGLNPIQHLATESERTIGKVNRNVKALTVAETGLVLLLTVLALFAVVTVVRDIIVAGCHQLAESLSFVNVHSFPALPYWPFIALLVILLLYLFRPWRLFRKRGYAGGASFAALDFANELRARHELAAAQREKILTYILVGLTLLLAVSLLFAVVTRHLPGAAKTSASCLVLGNTASPLAHAKHPTPPVAVETPTPTQTPASTATPIPTPTPTATPAVTVTPLRLSASGPEPSPIVETVTLTLIGTIPGDGYALIGAADGTTPSGWFAAGTGQLCTGPSVGGCTFYVTSGSGSESFQVHASNGAVSNTVVVKW